jgi:MFS transporter, DHA1 family, multidrug resistance protein
MDATVKEPQAATLGISRFEFISMIALLMACNALAIDVMLPGMQEIGAALGVSDENQRQLVITSYLLGFGAMQLLYGPISDRYGRRKPLFIGMSIYIVAAGAAIFVPTFGLLLTLRFIQGMGAAATRVIAIAVVRDVYGGRQMAEVMSLVFTVFMIVPIIAPNAGQLILLVADWHWIFLFMAAIAAVITIWAYMRLPETLVPEKRRPFTLASIVGGFRIVLTNRLSLWYTLGTTFIFGALFGFINSSEQVYAGIYGLGALFPVAFAGVAGLMSVASFMNSKLVVRYGMRRLSHTALLLFTGTAAISSLLAFLGPVPFWPFLGLFAITMVFFGAIGSNFGSIAMEPLGALAGTASSVQGFAQTVGGALVGAAIGQAFDGTVFPLTFGFFAVGFLGLVCVLIAEKGRLFGIGQSHTPQH